MTRRNPRETIGLWLEEGPVVVSAESRRQMLGEILGTPQSRGWRTWFRPTGRRPMAFQWVVAVLAVVMMLAATLLAVGFRLPNPNVVESGPNGLIAFDADWQIYTMNADGTDRRRIASGPNDFWPIWSPDGSKLLFHRTPTRGGVGVREVVQYWVAGPDGSEATNITRGHTIYRTSNWLPSWSPGGDAIVFASGNLSRSALYIARVDGEGIRQIVDTTLVPSAPSWSPIGDTIAFMGGHAEADRGIYLVDVDGSDLRKLTVNGPQFSYDSIALWSPDGHRLLFTAGDPGSDLWLIDADGSNQRRLTNMPPDIDVSEPAWSHDGSRIAYQRIDRAGSSSAVYVMDADGSDPIRISAEMLVAEPLAWSPDGNHVLTLVCSAACGTGREALDIVGLDPRGVDQPRFLANEPEAGSVMSWQRLGP